jgi:hypothetical protein
MSASNKPQMNNTKQTLLDETKKNEMITKIQALFRGYITRAKRLPLILYSVQKYLSDCKIKLTKTTTDGRINSCTDQDLIIDLLMKKYADKMYVPKDRMWYDILLKDTLYGWIPVNIKTTTTSTSDNTGNLAMCVYTYTDYKLKLKNSYQNGEMSQILMEKIKNNELNYKNKRDYYFLVVNKNNTQDVIINSVKGLKTLTANINNLPFQINWARNRYFQYKSIKECIKQFVECIQKPNPSWQEVFLSEIRALKV